MLVVVNTKLENVLVVVNTILQNVLVVVNTKLENVLVVVNAFYPRLTTNASLKLSWYF